MTYASPTFNIEAQDNRSKARAGLLQTPHGLIRTPIFMPVGTLGSVKAVHQHELHETIRAQIILSNTYHLYLRPGMDVISEAGGLHNFINWHRPILTDSGGYQVYSLSQRRKITEIGAQFMSHIDGSKHLFTPENVMQIQRTIGADIIMAFDECTPYPCEYAYAKNSMQLTHKWLDRCFNEFNDGTCPYGWKQILAPIAQGSTFLDLRAESCEYIASKDALINAIGGLSVGEPSQLLYEITEYCCQILPNHKARYLMGVGTPENLLECIGLGIDMFDCVLPSRNARHGLLYTTQGIIHIKNEKWKRDYAPIDPILNPNATIYSKAYLRHLFHSKEILAMQIATLQNLSFYLWLVNTAREKILLGEFAEWKKNILPIINQKL